MLLSQRGASARSPGRSQPAPIDGGSIKGVGSRLGQPGRNISMEACRGATFYEVLGAFEL